ISLRISKTLKQETDKIYKAQASRCVDFSTGKIKDRIKAIIPLRVPLFVNALKRAEELAIAMEARGYRGDEGRTKLRELKYETKDVIAFIIFIIVIIVVFIVRRYG